MKFLEFKLLTDENIDVGVAQFLRDQGCDVLDVRESNLIGTKVAHDN